MIPLFEEQTQPLTEYEREVILPLMIKGLEKKIGRDNAVTASQIEAGLKKKNIKASGPRIRKMINHIRNEQLIVGLMASSNGYYISTDIEEIRIYVESLRGREKAIRAVREIMEDYLHILLITDQIDINKYNR